MVSKVVFTICFNSSNESGATAPEEKQCSLILANPQTDKVPQTVYVRAFCKSISLSCVLG